MGNRRGSRQRRTVMRRLPVLIAALSLLATACSDDGSGESFGDPSSTTEVVLGDDLPDQVVVFTSDDSEIDANGEPVTWTPGIEDVLSAEAALAEHIEANPDLGVDAIDTYARQYVGIGDGEDVVSVNALCAVDDLDWEDQLIVVADGGPCFWHATVDLPTQAVQTFTVNGEA
jgi:hypothetical protein